MTAPRRGEIRLFCVEDHEVQVIWRDLAAAALTLEVRDDRGRPVGERSVDAEEAAGAGGTMIGGLPADRDLVLTARRADGTGVARIPFRTASSLPGEELCRIATISDLHLGATVFGHRGTITEGPHLEGPHPLRCTRAAIVAASDWGAEALVGKGDLTNTASIGAWRDWAGLVHTSPIPVLSLPGNHDRSHPSATAPLDASDAAALFGFELADPLLVRDLAGLRLVLVDTCIPGSNRGTLRLVRDGILAAASEVPADTAVIVALHHQLQPVTGPEVWPIGIPHPESRRFLADLAAVHPRSLVTSGHTHRHRRWSHAGVTTTQVGSVKDFPGVWAGYTISEGGLRQSVRRVTEPSCVAWTDHTRRAAAGLWRFIAPGPMRSRTFDLRWDGTDGAP